MATSTTSRPAAFAAGGRAGRRGAPRRRSSPRRGRSGRSRGNQSWWPLVVVGLVVLAGVAWARSDLIPETGGCTVDGGSVRVTAEQAGHADTIARVAREKGLPERAAVIALATALQESGLRNLDHGDRDSLGLFQQRPSQGWGTPAQVQDPVYAAGIFYDRLVTVPGWDTGRLTDVAQTVQRSGFPEAYQKHEATAQELAVALTENTLTCTEG
ncbi:hypothetical protein [Candidatus Blastococcus massiliensis]|uniref:hypothetical protein n=1 Tax=Candidatus Blastococcus massiliensis TaxID=1470358 RepID=UPI0004B36B7D|nr:hypothetical protein [Candidatus Blastococcus massiliensis]